MMLSKVLLLAAAYGSPFSHDPPPPRYQGNTTVTVRFGSQEEVSRECSIGLPPPPAGRRYMACNKADGTIWMPNPCSFAVGQDYALTMCHEMGHHNGWTGNHPQ